MSVVGGDDDESLVAKAKLQVSERVSTRDEDDARSLHLAPVGKRKGGESEAHLLKVL